MARPALSGILPGTVILALLGGCASVARPPPTRPADDLPPPTRSVDGRSVAVAGDGRRAVAALVDALRGALEARDVDRVRALFAPTLGGVQQPGPGMSREAWLTSAEALFAAAARGRPWLRGAPVVVSYAECAPRCPSARLAPGEWLVRWPAGAGARAALGLPSDHVLPSTLRVSVTDGAAAVVGVDDEIATARGPAPVRLSGWLRP